MFHCWTWIKTIGPVIQCCDTVGWVIWPVKSSLKWPIINVSSGTLNPTIPYHTIPYASW